MYLSEKSCHKAGNSFWTLTILHVNCDKGGNSHWTLTIRGNAVTGTGKSLMSS